MSNRISGVTKGSGNDIDQDVSEDVEELSEILSGLEDPERISTILDRTIRVEGVEIIREDSDITDDAFGEDAAGAITGIQDTLEEELDSLSGVTSQTELLRQVAARLSVTAASIQSLEEEIRLLDRDFSEQNRQIFKDFGTEEIDSSGRSQDVVDEDDIITTSVLIKAHATNDGNLYVGSDTVRTTDGYKIEPGSSETIPIDLSRQQLQIISEENDEDYSYIAFGTI